MPAALGASRPRGGLPVPQGEHSVPSTGDTKPRAVAEGTRVPLDTSAHALVTPPELSLPAISVTLAPQRPLWTPGDPALLFFPFLLGSLFSFCLGLPDTQWYQLPEHLRPFLLSPGGPSTRYLLSLHTGLRFTEVNTYALLPSASL